MRDQDYLRWLENPEVTLGKGLRLEIAARLRELIDGVAVVPIQRQENVSESKRGKESRQTVGDESKKTEAEWDQP